MTKHENKAVLIIQTLVNAAGADFEDLDLAVSIVADSLEKEDARLLILNSKHKYLDKLRLSRISDQDRLILGRPYSIGYTDAINKAIELSSDSFEKECFNELTQAQNKES